MTNLCAKIGRFLRAKKGVVKKFAGCEAPRPPSSSIIPGAMAPLDFGWNRPCLIAYF